MDQQRIIKGIEKVFEEYTRDEELRVALTESYSHSGNTRLQLFPKHWGSHYLDDDGRICVKYDDIRGHGISSPEYAAQDFFDYFCSRCKPPITLTKAKAMLERDLGARVEKVKGDYARGLTKKEGRYVFQYPMGY